ncbi:MAG: hypothetical protein U0694_18200 [Anaerolineae bacterium]
MTLREDVISKIERTSDKELAELAHYIEIMQNPELPADYDPDNDPSVGFISGPTDWSERSEDILFQEFGIQDEAADK